MGEARQRFGRTLIQRESHEDVAWHGDESGLETDRLEQNAVQDRQVVTVSTPVLQRLAWKLKEIDLVFSPGELGIGGFRVDGVPQPIQA